MSRNKREGWYVGKHVWCTKGARLHFWKEGRHRDHRGFYPTTVCRKTAAYKAAQGQL